MLLRLRTISVYAAIATAILLSATYAHAQYAELKMQSDPRDFVGQGGTYDLLFYPENTQYLLASVLQTLPDGQPSVINFSMDQSDAPGNFADVEFATDLLSIPIQPGIYDNAERVHTAPGHPGLDIAFQGRGPNSLTGSFTIENAIFSPDADSTNGWKVDSFQADFIQHSEGATPALHGSFTYSAVTVPESSSLIFVGSGLILGMGMLHRKRKQRSL